MTSKVAKGTENLRLTFTEKALRNINPRVKDRTETKWDGPLTITESGSINEALEILVENNILALPVVDTRKQVVGMVSMGAIIEWIISCFDSVDEMNTNIKDFLETRERLKTTRVSMIANNETFSVIPKTSSIYAALELMVRGDDKRLFCLNFSGEIAGIITQSMLIGEVYNNFATLSEKVKKMKVRELSKSYYVSTIQETSTAISALRKMNTWDRSALGVVNEQGVLVDQLTNKDLRGIGKDAEAFLNLFKTVKEFKEFSKKVAKKPIKVQMVTQNSTFKDVIEILDQQETHHVFVVDSLTSKRPLYVITATDILRMLVPSLGYY